MKSLRPTQRLSADLAGGFRGPALPGRTSAPGRGMPREKRICRTCDTDRCPTSSRARHGAILVWLAVTLTLLMGMLGLVVDSGFLMAAHRHLQSATDAAAIAAADDLLLRKSDRDATLTAMDYLQLRNQLEDAFGTVNIPPQSGPYAGRAGFVEVIAQHTLSTYFVHLLPGTDSQQTIRCRAVAGNEIVPVIDGILLLDPSARPGLSVTGNASISVNGRISVNSDGGGFDENGQAIENGSDGIAGFVSRFSSVQATDVRVVGGVNRPEGFENYIAGQGNPLRTNQLPVPDPLLHLDTPSIDNGVLNIDRGAPHAGQSGMDLNNPNDDSESPNFVYTDESSGADVMVLNPGIYSSISVSAGRVEFRPGIYVLRPTDDQPFTLQIVGGDVRAEGVMFYNTGDDYDPVSGQPDAFDDRQGMASTEGTRFGEIRIDATMNYSPIDTRLYNYGDVSPAIAQFDGLFIYQRRDNSKRIQIQGYRGTANLSGTVYARSAEARMPARGTYRSQFIVGSMQLPGHADINLELDNSNAAKAPRVFLVE